MRDQRGIAMVLVLIFLGVGGLLLAPTLRHVATALNFYGISRESAEVEYALDAVTQQALWLLQYEDAWEDCVTPLDSVDDSFVECVAEYGSWDLATADYFDNNVNESLISPVNSQQVEVSVEVPGAIAVAADPTPTPNAVQCIHTLVDRSPHWVEVGKPITYTFHIINCGDKNFQIRRIKAIFPGSFIYTATATTDSVHPLIHGDTSGAPTGADLVPEEIFCDGSATPPDPDYFPCAEPPPDQITDGSLLLNWPTGTSNFNNYFTDLGEEWDWVFQVTPTTFGVFYVESIVCYFSAASGDPGPCRGSETDTKRSGKVKPVIVGMFNIQGKGKGHAYGASSKLDSGGSDLLSEQPQ